MHVPGNTGFIIKGITQPSICYKVRTPSGVFGVASLALYASAPNHVFGQMLGLLPYIPFLSAKAVKGELLRLCPSYSG